MLELYEELSAISTTERDVPLKKMTTLRVGGEAAYVVYPENEMSLDAIMRIIRKNSIPFKVIGKGSNLLCGDGRYEIFFRNGVEIDVESVRKFADSDGNSAGSEIVTAFYHA